MTRMAEPDPGMGMCLDCGEWSWDIICPRCGYMTERYFWVINQRESKRETATRKVNKARSKPESKRPAE